GHVGGRAVGDVAVRPSGRLPGRGPRRVEAAGLGNDQVRLVANPAVPRGRFRRGDFLERAADVDGAGPAARFRLPRDRFTQRIIDLVHAGAVAELFQLAAVPIREPLAGQLEDLL